MSLAQINKAIAKQDPRCELVRGDGYHYLVWDDVPTNLYETESIYVCYTNMLPTARWLEEAQAFIAEQLKHPRYTGDEEVISIAPRTILR